MYIGDYIFGIYGHNTFKKLKFLLKEEFLCQIIMRLEKKILVEIVF